MEHVEILPQNKIITASYIKTPDLAEHVLIETALVKLPKYAVNYSCWNKLNDMPQVTTTIAYRNLALVVMFDVIEISNRATYTKSNDPVFKDSCVELFIAIDDSGYYYNFEFNSFGTCLASYGKDRQNRQKLQPQVIDTINRWVNWKEFSPQKPVYRWTLTFSLPPQVFCYHNIRQFKPATYKVNLYKCGDELPEPHYLAWNPITTAEKDFHQPEFFGTLILA